MPLTKAQTGLATQRALQPEPQAILQHALQHPTRLPRAPCSLLGASFAVRSGMHAPPAHLCPGVCKRVEFDRFLYSFHGSPVVVSFWLHPPPSPAFLGQQGSLGSAGTQHANVSGLLPGHITAPDRCVPTYSDCQPEFPKKMDERD